MDLQDYLHVLYYTTLLNMEHLEMNVTLQCLSFDSYMFLEQQFYLQSSICANFLW